MPRKDLKAFREYQKEQMRRRREKLKAGTAGVISPATPPQAAESPKAEVVPPTTSEAAAKPVEIPSKYTLHPELKRVKPRLIITMKQTEDKEKDIALLHELVNLISMFPGKEKFWLKVDQPDKITTLAFPYISFDLTHQLELGLTALLLTHEDQLKVEDTLNNSQLRLEGVKGA